MSQLCRVRMAGLGLVLVGIASACAVLPPRASSAAGLRSAPSDTVLLSAVIRAQQARAGTGQIVRVDPRPLTLDLGLAPEHTEVAQGAVSEVPVDLVRERTLLLARLGVIRADVVDDYRCHGTTGLLPPPPPDGVREPARVRDPDPCSAKGTFISLVFGLPRSGGAYYPPANIDERDEGKPKGYWTVRMIHMSPSGFGIYDMVLGRSAGGGWQLVEEKRLYHIVS